jgi:hypothetical protein
MKRIEGGKTEEEGEAEDKEGRAQLADHLRFKINTIGPLCLHLVHPNTFNQLMRKLGGENLNQVKIPRYLKLKESVALLRDNSISQIN